MMELSIGLGICLLLVWSWQRAERLGTPWFSLGRQQSRTHPAQFRKRMRTKSIKPQSPWLKPTIESSQRIVSARPTQHRQRKQSGPGGKAFHRLYQLTHNVEIAERLVRRLAEKHPDRDLLWCIQKAIYDIERDRQAR